MASGAFYALFLVASGFGVLAAAMFVGGVSRALDSGPLESWFVDRTKAVDEAVDLRGGLSRGGTVDGVALGLGSIVGGALPAVFDGRLLVSVGVASTFQVVHLGAVLVLMDEPRRSDRAGSARLLVAASNTVRDGAPNRYPPSTGPSPPRRRGLHRCGAGRRGLTVAAPVRRPAGP